MVCIFCCRVRKNLSGKQFQNRSQNEQVLLLFAAHGPLRQKHKITYTHFETICARKTPPKKIDPFPIRSRLKTTITTGKISSSKSIEHDDHDEDDDHDKKNHDDEKNLMTRKNSCKGMKDLRRLVRNQRLGDQNECHAAWES